MYQNLFKKIKERLLTGIKEMPSSPTSGKALGRGAAGDKTYPVDRLAEDIIISELELSGESFSIISEEYGVMEIKGGGRKVLIDPIDGSKNAISGIPFFCSSIAIADGDNIGSIETAFVLNLINGDEFFAERGRGAFLNDKRIKTQEDDEFYLIAYEAQSPKKDIASILPLLSKAFKTRCLGATALDLAYLARGAISVFVNPSLSRSFDFAGGYLLVKEAGGIFTDIKGNPVEEIEIGLKKSSPLLASGNIKLHERSLRLLMGFK
ncbi:MAG: inositol monophosphatase family protein [Thermodesulfovibrionales bacterium]